MNTIQTKDTSIKVVHPVEFYALRYGFNTAFALFSYFLLMDGLRLSHVIGLRYFNIAILFGGVFWGLRHFYAEHGKDEEGFFFGFITGVFITVVASGIFSLVMYLYLLIVNPLLGHEILNLLGIQVVTFELLMLVLFLEVSMLGIIFSLISMQYYKC